MNPRCTRPGSPVEVSIYPWCGLTHLVGAALLIEYPIAL